MTFIGCVAVGILAVNGISALEDDAGSESIDDDADSTEEIESEEEISDGDEELPMPIRGLRSVAYETHKAVFDNDFMKSEWIQFLPPGHVPMRNVMFAPLNLVRIETL